MCVWFRKGILVLESIRWELGKTEGLCASRGTATCLEGRWEPEP